MISIITPLTFCSVSSLCWIALMCHTWNFLFIFASSFYNLSINEMTKKKKPTKKNLLLENRWPSSCTSRTSIPGVRLTPCLFCFLLLIYLFLMENFLNKVISLLFKKIFSSYFIGINLLACGDLILGDAIFKIL